MAAWDDGKSLFKVLLRWPEFCCSEDTVLFCPSSWNDWMEVSPRGTFLLLIHKITNRTRRFQGNLVAPNKFKEEEGMDAIKPGSSWFYKVYEMNTTLELVKDTDHPSMPVQIPSCTFESKVPPLPRTHRLGSILTKSFLAPSFFTPTYHPTWQRHFCASPCLSWISKLFPSKVAFAFSQGSPAELKNNIISRFQRKLKSDPCLLHPHPAAVRHLPYQCFGF